jgi:uncharacterized repeat protein (TIGR03803 family)
MTVETCTGRRRGHVDKFNWGVKVCGVLLLLAATAIVTSAQTFTTLYTFCSRGGNQCTDGDRPIAGLVQGTDGNFYGTTVYGGANICNDIGPCGTVFKITPDGKLTTLHSFDEADGEFPYAGLIQATDGNFYGTTSQGGANCAYNGCGTIFSITPSGSLTTLYSFCSQPHCPDGAFPYVGLVQGTDGNFYGTMPFDGANGNYGTVFKIIPTGALTTLHSFDGTDGYQLAASLIQATDGSFYGTAGQGGAFGFGTLFHITASGLLTPLTLHSFDEADGKEPSAAVVQGTDGNIYGTTYECGAYCEGHYDEYGCGTVFSITPSGKLTTLYNFCPQDTDNCADGRGPNGIVQATDGNFYGTTYRGGADNAGTIFKITPSGALTTLYNFCSRDKHACEHGLNPSSALTQGTDGDFYGTTHYGGAKGAGIVFSLSVGLGPFVETNPTSGKVGKPVKILGTNLTGASSVTFNGTAARFTVKSRSEITTTVPTGATIGTVQVVTPGGTLKSNVPFTVK